MSTHIKRIEFFDAVRQDLFGGRLSQPQVDALNMLLDTWQRILPTADRRWIANSLAQVYHETGARMVPVRETFASSDEQAKSRLETAWRRGRLPWVRTPYWRDGWYGRGQIQISHRPNYDKLGRRLGIDLIAEPDLALVPSISAEIVVVGMSEGLFAGRKLHDYFNATTDDSTNARRIVNDPDGTDARVADLHRRFLNALDD